MKPNTRILILDDDRDVCRLYFAALAKEGREILTASSAHSGLHSAALYAPDILLVDIGLRSGPDGFSFLEKWAAQYNKGGKVVMISGRDDSESMERARRLGVAGYLVKPVSPQALESVVASLESELVGGVSRRIVLKTPKAAGSGKSHEMLGEAGGLPGPTQKLEKPRKGL